VLAIYTGNAVTNLRPVETFVTQAYLIVRAGVTYQLAVDSNSSGGRILLNLYYTTPLLPVFNSQPASTTNTIGDSVVFSAGVFGIGPITFQWQRDGLDIPGATNVYYAISGVQTNDAGTYTLLATDAAGTTSSTAAVLTVLPWSFTVLHSFGGGNDGANPYAGVVQGGDGAFYGTTLNGGSTGKGTVFKLTFDGSGYSVLHSFGGGNDGANPYAGLVQGSDGVFYGTTLNGGSIGKGTVFRLNVDGSGYRVLHDFGSGGDGEGPGGLVQASNGTFYGTTGFGGANGNGTVFDMDTNGTLTVYASFNGLNGSEPSGKLVEGTDGNFYGTTIYGGTGDPPYGGGTVFSMTPSGVLATIHAFDAGPVGEYPYAGLLMGNDGRLYGSTSYSSTIFRMTTSGTIMTLLATWGSQTTLLQGRDGYMYGVSSSSIFRMTANGVVTILCDNFNYGASGALLQGSDGALYGTTWNGGNGGEGIVFRFLNH